MVLDTLDYMVCGVPNLFSSEYQTTGEVQETNNTKYVILSTASFLVDPVYTVFSS